MLICETAFYKLKATPLMTKAQLCELAEERAFSLDENECRRAMRALLLSSSRLEQEISWMDESPSEKGDARKCMDEANEGRFDYLSFPRFLALPELTRCNLLAYALYRAVDMGKAANLQLDPIFESFARAYEKINSREIAKHINKDRAVAGFPPLREDAAVEAALKLQHDLYISVFVRLFRALPSSRYTRALTTVIDQVTRGGNVPDLCFLDELVRVYEDDIGDKLEIKAAFIARAEADLREKLDEAAGNKTNPPPLLEEIAKLRKYLEAWDEIAQPIQVSYKSQGKEHADSIHVASVVRDLALYAFNRHGRLDVADDITRMLEKAFVEVPKVRSKLQEDRRVLEKLLTECDLMQLAPMFVRLKAGMPSPQEALQEAARCLREAPPVLEQMDKPARGKNFIAQTLFNAGVKIANEKKAYLVAIAFLTTAQQYVLDWSLRNTIKENLATLHRNYAFTLKKKLGS